jgi:molecular chaperone DnaJ
MPIKDYYHVLNIPPGSSPADIKKAFRKLAMAYHPDKHQDSSQYNSYFSEIQEAYEVLSDPEKKERYHYQRWLERSMGHALDDSLSAEEILKLFIKAEKYISESDAFRINKTLLLHQLLELFSTSRLTTILRNENQSLNTESIKLAIKTSSYLDSQGAVILMRHFKHFLDKDPEQRILWQNVINTLKHKEKISWLTVPIALLITLLLCLILFFAARK